MKGAAIAMETIVFVILAVLVLTVLLFFFTSTAGPAQTEFELRAQQRVLCGQYIQVDNKCEDTNKAGGVLSDARGADGRQKPLLAALGDTCTGLKVVGCSQSPDLKCVQRCCDIFCPNQP